MFAKSSIDLNRLAWLPVTLAVLALPVLFGDGCYLNVMALKVAGRAYVMEVGRITVEGDARDPRESDIVRKLYLAV